MAHWNQVGTPLMTLGSPEQIARFFDRLDLLEPGVVPCSLWRPDISPLGGRPPAGRRILRRRPQGVTGRIPSPARLGRGDAIGRPSLPMAGYPGFSLPDNYDRNTATWPSTGPSAIRARGSISASRTGSYRVCVSFHPSGPPPGRTHQSEPQSEPGGHFLTRPTYSKRPSPAAALAVPAQGPRMG